jgi:CheY-like chemotaxis protein
MSDPKRLKQALSYLVSNAIKFTQVGSVNIEACLRNFDADEHRLAFIIKDSGAGINKEQAKKLFLPFAQADSSSTRVFAGTGLGLILARKLAQGLGGDVVLQESSVNSGSVFVFTIDPGKLEVPMAQNEEKSSNIQVDPTPSVPRLDGKSVLIVEDSADLQLLFSHFLLASGAKVETANNGAEGVEKALSGDYHIVLMDLQMPIMDGHEALQVLKKNHFAKPVIALTAHARNEERIKCLENGFIEHLAKPVNRESLIKAVWQQTYATPSHPHESIN